MAAPSLVSALEGMSTIVRAIRLKLSDLSSGATWANGAAAGDLSKFNAQVRAPTSDAIIDDRFPIRCKVREQMFFSVDFLVMDSIDSIIERWSAID